MQSTVEANNYNSSSRDIIIYLDPGLKYATKIHDIGSVWQILNLNESQTAVEFHWLSIDILYVATRRSYQETQIKCITYYLIDVDCILSYATVFYHALWGRLLHK